jgi:hypothetical protein
VAYKINVMLGENQGLIGDEQSEHNIEVESHYEVPSHLVDDSVFQRLVGTIHGILSSNGLGLTENAALRRASQMRGIQDCRGAADGSKPRRGVSFVQISERPTDWSRLRLITAHLTSYSEQALTPDCKC